MKKHITFLTVLMAVMLALVSCRNTGKDKESSAPESVSSTPAGFIQVGKEIITDIIIRPDTLGDPWEVEKVKGFDGSVMFSSLIENIYNNKLKVYSPINEEVINPSDVKKIMDDLGADLKKIAKLQFCDDWFFDPATGNIVRKTKSITLGYEVKREEGLPASYRVMFRIKL